MKPVKEIIYNYHNQTKHRPYRYARSLGYLDWDNEPNPFRKFQGAEKINLPIHVSVSSPPFYKVLFQPENITPQPINPDTISLLFLNSLGISAWKEYRGSRWAVRCNPSSGNLHPTEAYLIAPPQLLGNNYAVLYHYDPSEHILEKRAVMNKSNWGKQGLPSPDECPYFFIALTSLTWREAWKYGERAFRYCLLDMGHAIACITLSARTLGWQVQYTGISLSNLSVSLGLNRPEYEHIEKEFPQILLLLHPQDKQPTISSLSFLDKPFLFDEWYGIPEKISPQTVDWEIIDEVSSALIKSSETFYSNISSPNNLSITQSETRKSIVEEIHSPPSFTLFQQRRSAHAFDRNASLRNADFIHILRAIHYTYNQILKNVIPLSPSTSLLFFLHNVEHLQPGIYAYLPTPYHHAKLTPLLFEKLTPIDTPDNLPFFFCYGGNMREIAGYLCCGQEIARDGVLCACIFTDLDKELENYDGFTYAPLHWEAGFIGQILYLEAEIYRLRGTGIGCFFDDEITRLRKQSQLTQTPIHPLYFFTMGKPILDTRIKTYPPYSTK